MLDDVHAGPREGAPERLERGVLQRTGDGDVVALDDRRQDAHRGAGTSNGARNGERERLFTVQDRPEQRTPGQGDPQVVDAALQRSEGGTRVGDDEQRVRYTALLWRSRCVAERVSTGIDADDERIWILSG
jgi:hypothetical protein